MKSRAALRPLGLGALVPIGNNLAVTEEERLHDFRVGFKDLSAAQLWVQDVA